MLMIPIKILNYVYCQSRIMNAPYINILCGIYICDQVQRSVEDQSIVVATYEGEHNHPHPSKAEGTANRSSTLGNSASMSPLTPKITLDLTKPNQETVASSRGKGEAAPDLQHHLVEQMASTLTKDPSFKAALTAAISGKFLQQNNHREKW